MKIKRARKYSLNFVNNEFSASQNLAWGYGLNGSRQPKF